MLHAFFCIVWLFCFFPFTRSLVGVCDCNQSLALWMFVILKMLGEVDSSFLSGDFNFSPLFSFCRFGFPLPPSVRLPFDSQFIQTRQVAQSLLVWSLGSSQTGSFQPPALTARGALILSRGTLSLPGWIRWGRLMHGLLLTTTAQSGSRWGKPQQSPFLKILFSLKLLVGNAIFFLLLPQVDLEKTKRLTGIITQGAKDFGVVQFVSVFKVAYSNDGESWSTVKENTGNDKVRRMWIPEMPFPLFFSIYVKAKLKIR